MPIYTAMERHGYNCRAERLEEHSRADFAMIEHAEIHVLHEEIRKLQLQVSGLLERSDDALQPKPPSHSDDEKDFCLHDDGQITAMSQAEIASAKQWMERLQTRTNSMWEKLESHSNEGGPVAPFERPVRIAVIDTGAAIEDSDLDDLYGNRLIECRTWIGEDPGRLVECATSDTVGHGTHATSLTLKVTENTNCEVYVAQCFDNTPQQKLLPGEDSETMAEAIALAIEYAVQHWEVDIISLSYGTDQAVHIIEDVIDEQARKVIFFAAASTWGGNDPRVSWPARHGEVISMCASDAHGNSYGRNPNPRQNHHNFSMLGTAVSGLWPRKLQPGRPCKYKSGTSCATPIAAGVAANVLTLMRRQATLELLKVPTSGREHAVQATERLLKKLQRRSVMKNVMFEIGAKSNKRQGYDYVAPWHLFEGSPEAAFARIKDVVDAS